ncbi:MAG TPA: protein-glutamate O-methyltransferase CheR [Gemmatimonadaceae bacterium]|jgi:chemotaxis protein methyltransferase WspC
MSAEIERILRDEIGLDASTVGSSLIERAAKRRMMKRGIGAIDAYAGMLADDEHELQALIEEVVVPETYFFREPDAIADVTRRALDAHAMHADAMLRVLSVPCSSGEEPYSIALSLLEAGLPASSIAIDAIDVSVEAVHRAEAGVYRTGSFRGDFGTWKKHFVETAHGWKIEENVRSLVRVAHGNLLSEKFDPPREQYDVIFCRNLLIYFDEGAQARALDRIASLLAADGVLVVGSADSFAARRAGFAPSPGSERSFLFRHNGSSAGAEALPRVTRRVRSRAISARPARLPVARKIVARAIQPAMRVSAAPTAASVLAEVVRLANQKQPATAIDVGERAIRDGVASAELLALVGTLHAATPQLDRAEACYRKALFLEPTNEDALLHLALLLERRGETALASKLRSRARRALSFHTFAGP